jgi:DNA-binding NarL/FixJ family response regulator
VLQPIRVLVVDDHESYRHAMAAIVEATDGFVVVGLAESGEQSLEMVERIAPDLVLMDVNLPGMTGIEATRRITAGADAPMVALLSTYDEGELDHADCGAAAYINKAAFGPDRLTALWALADTG